MSRQAIFSVLLRGSTLVAKFGLTLLLAIYLPLDELGHFGLFLACTAVLNIVAGLEFYQFATRERLAGQGPPPAQQLRDQLVLHASAHLILLPVAGFVLHLSGLSTAAVVAGTLLLLLEQVGQEAYRYFLNSMQAALANLLLFLRHAAWVPLLALLLWQRAVPAHLETVLCCWAGGTVAGLSLALRHLSRQHLRPNFRTGLDWSWLRRGLQTSTSYLAIATLGTLTIYLNRFALSANGDAGAVGVLLFHWNFTNAALTLVDAGAVSLLSPFIVQAHVSGDRAKVAALTRAMWQRAWLGFAALAVLLHVSLPAFVGLFHLRNMAIDLGLLSILSLATGAQLLVALLSVSLYARHLDRAALRAASWGFAGSAAANAALVPALGLPGAALGSLAGSLIQALQQWQAIRRAPVTS